MDIFVRHSFGNFFDVLKEVSYSPMMAKMLTFVNSKSQEKSGAFPDENYARELMQLFSIGPWLLNEDGTRQTDANGRELESYNITDIENFARAWTGFQVQQRRGNAEASGWIDPMKIVGDDRDSNPKTVPTGNGYLGDQQPLCTDLPARAFLHKGASYRFLGKRAPFLKNNRQWAPITPPGVLS